MPEYLRSTIVPSRRRMLQMLGAVSAVGAGGWALLAGGRANAYYQGPPSDHFDGVRFFNPGGVRPQGTGRVPQVAAGRPRRGVAEELPEPLSAGPAAGALRRRGVAHRPRRACQPV